MTLCDWIVLLELAALAVAGVRIWQLGLDRDRAIAELDEAYLAGAAVVDQTWRTERRAGRQLWRNIKRKQAMRRVAKYARAAVRRQRQLELIDRQLNAAIIDRDTHAGRAIQLSRMVTDLAADCDAHADRAQQLARRVTEMESRLLEAGARIDELIADNAAALGIQSGGER